MIHPSFKRTFAGGDARDSDHDIGRNMIPIRADDSSNRGSTVDRRNRAAEYLPRTRRCRAMVSADAPHVQRGKQLRA